MCAWKPSYSVCFTQGSQEDHHLSNLLGELQQQSYAHGKEMAQMESRLEHEQRAVENRENDLKRLQSRFKDVSYQLHTKNQEFEATQRELVTLNRTVEEMETENRELMVARQRENVDAQRVLEDKESELRDICQRHEEELLELEREIAQLHQTISEKDDNIANAFATLQQQLTLSMRISESTTLATSDEVDIEQLQQRDRRSQEREMNQESEHAENGKRDFETLRSKLKELLQEKIHLRDVIEKKQMEIHRLEEEMEKMDRKLRRHGITREGSEGRNLLAEKETELQQKIQECEGLAATIEQLRREISHLKQQLEEKNITKGHQQEREDNIDGKRTQQEHTKPTRTAKQSQDVEEQNNSESEDETDGELI